MRAAAATLLAALAVLALAACGGGEELTATPETVVGTVEQPPAPDVPELPEGDPGAGADVWASAGCGSCHVLADAGSTGVIGPDLDQSQPDLALVIDRVLNGAGAMPSFREQLDDQQIADVAAYVVQATSG
jgi:mono/diheme cytochrome c family protein